MRFLRETKAVASASFRKFGTSPFNNISGDRWYIYSEVILVLRESNNNKLKFKFEGPVGVDSNFAKGWILFESNFNTLVD